MKLFDLKCSNCGGLLKANEDQVRVYGNVVSICRDNVLKCQSCGSEFLPGDELGVSKNNTQIVQGDGNIVAGNISNSSGVVIGRGARSVTIKGDVVGGSKTTIITGDSNIVVD